MVRAIDDLVTRPGIDQGAQVFHFPPIVPRFVLEQSGYLQSFPDLLGSIDVFEGNDELHGELLERFEQGEDWAELLRPSEVTLCSAACHPLYPLLSGEPSRRRSPLRGASDSAFATSRASTRRGCRASASTSSSMSASPTTPSAIATCGSSESAELLSASVSRSRAWSRTTPSSAGPGGCSPPTSARMPSSTRSSRPIQAGAKQTAIASCNYHVDHFGLGFAIETAAGEVAHSACVGFGVERITLALLARHGLEPSGWPRTVRARLFS